MEKGHPNLENERFLIESILRYAVPQKKGAAKSGGKLEEMLKKANLPVKKEFSFIDDILGMLSDSNNEIKKFEAMAIPDTKNET